MVDSDLLATLRWLAEQARTSAAEDAVLQALLRQLSALEGVDGAAFWQLPNGAGSRGRSAPADVQSLLDGGAPDGDGASGRMVVPVFADSTMVGVLGLDLDGDGDGAGAAAVYALVATAAATLTARKAIELSRVDMLTRVLSRSALESVLDEEIARARRNGHRLRALLLDLDGFKVVNDELGHAAGDHVLREVGVALHATVRPYDHVGRLGGDEFVVVLPDTDGPAAATIAERLRAAVARRASAAVGASIDCSIGIAELGHADEAADLLDLADRALGIAKRDGKGRVADHRPAPAHAPASPAISVDDEPLPELRDALAGTGVRTVFQPIRTLPNRQLVGFEALTRGAGRLERPDRLLAHARRTGHLIALDEQLRATAFATATDHGLQTPLSLFVNIEPESLVALADYPDFWRRGNLPFPSITEITERSLFASPGRLLAACARLREFGWGIALDDVGQDPRALGLIALLAPDVIKLDLRLLADRPPAELAAVVVAVTAETQRSGARVLAEGIETDEHEHRARALGATLGQGYHYGRPGQLELGGDRDARPIARNLPTHAPRGVTPFTLVAGALPVQEADVGLLTELQVALERRALGLGMLAVLATTLPNPALDPGAHRRMTHLADDVGFVVLLSERDAPHHTGGLLTGTLPDGHPLRDEWVTVVACPQYALTLVARRLRPRSTRFSYALSHDTATGLQVAESLLLALDGL